MKLLDSLVKPILLYGSDFWGILKLNQNNPLEILHCAFCKHLLGVQKYLPKRGVQKQTTNIGVLLELGQIPLQNYAKKNPVKSLGKKNVVLKCYYII